MKEAIERAERGIIDANLDGGLIKQRVARSGLGRSGGYRLLAAYRANERAVVLYGFAKSDEDNIDEDELETLRTVGANWLAVNASVITKALAEGDLEEIEHDEEET